MTISRGTRYKVKTLPSGKRVKQTITSSGRIVKVVPVTNKASHTKTNKRLNKRRRRIYR